MKAHFEFQVCQAEGKEEWIEEQSVPYMYKDNLWVGFDNQRSIRAKVRGVTLHTSGSASAFSPNKTFDVQ